MKKYYFLIAVVLIIAVSSCSYMGYISVKPTGEYVTKKLQTGNFENVSVSSGFELILTQDSNRELSIETYENTHEYIIVEVEGNTLKIYRKNGINFTRNPNVKIYLSCNYLNKISSSGGGRINLNNGWSGDELKISLSGGSKVFGRVRLNSLFMSMSGGSKSELEGIVGYLTISSSGGSVHKHFSLEAQKCNAAMSGGASAELNVSESLKVAGSGGTKVRYKGNPQLSVKLSGGSSVKKAEL
ncbi:MAG: head GIN domain-containing protein [Rikenellaceae bacterium]